MYKKTNTIIFIIAVILAGVAIYSVMNYVNGIKEAYTNIPMKSVVAASQNIPDNVNIEANMLKIVKVPADTVLPQAYDSIEKIVGSITKTDIVKDEHILSNHIYKEGVGEGKDKFSYSVPENMRAVSIAINDVSGVSGLIKPNDHVDILLTYAFAEDRVNGQTETDANSIEEDKKWQLQKEYLSKISKEILNGMRIISIDAKEITFTMLQNVKVLAVYGSNNANKEDKENKNSATVTLALDPQDVEILTNAEAVGNLKLSLRSPIDEKIVDLEPIKITR